MRGKIFLAMAILGAMLLGAPGWSAQEAKGEPPPTPDPLKVLQQMCDFLKAQKQFAFQAEVVDDRVYQDGKKLQYAFGLEVFARRPDRLKVVAAGDLENKELFYDGKSLTLYEKPNNLYAAMTVPGSIDAALDQAHKEYGLRVALADLACANLGDLVKAGVQHALYVGRHRVHGIPCHHLALDRDDLHIQIWVQTGNQPLPRKVVITQKRLPHSPTWSAYIARWNLKAKLPDKVFVFKPPPGAQQIKFLAAKPKAAAPAAAPQPKKEGEKP